MYILPYMKRHSMCKLSCEKSTLNRNLKSRTLKRTFNQKMMNETPTLLPTKARNIAYRLCIEFCINICPLFFKRCAVMVSHFFFAISRPRIGSSVRPGHGLGCRSPVSYGLDAGAVYMENVGGQSGTSSGFFVSI
jgi:hypothetical protein